MNIQTLSVIGTGTMGRGIIETASTVGFKVNAIEPDESQRIAAQKQIEQSIMHAAKRGKLADSDPAQAAARISWFASVASTSSVASSDFVIEAISENEEAKVCLFKQLDAVCKPGVILASNTSSISITRLAEATNRADRVVGMHFFNPVPIMQPVEIVRGKQTSSQTLEATRTLADRLRKKPFTVNDRPGFVVNRILMPLINEAAFALQEEVADAETIDSLMKLGCNHPMGPLELADLVGLDVCLSILRVLQHELGDKFRPCPLLEQKVTTGQLGRKTGQGFYRYSVDVAGRAVVEEP